MVETKLAIFLAIIIVLSGCIEQQNYKKPTAPIYAFENFEKALSHNDYGFAWNCLSSGFKQSQFNNSFESFKSWIDKKNASLEEMLSGEYVSELIVKQNAEMLLKKPNGDIRFVKENNEWKLDSLLLQKK